jgi:hypothetical protein
VSYVPRAELVGCQVSLIGPGRTHGGELFDDGTRGVIVGLKGKHGSHNAKVRVRATDGREFECKRARLIITRKKVGGP